jgi:hypothetical protein
MADEFNILVEPIDGKAIYADDAANDSEVWPILMWGNQRDRALIQRLKHLRSIERNVPSDGTRRGIEFGDRKQHRPELADRRILRKPDFPSGDLFWLCAVDLPTLDDPHIHLKDSTDFSAFSLPQLVIKRSWCRPISRFQARIVDASEKSGVLCTQSYVTVHLPIERMHEIEAACLSYNSILAVYFLLLTSSRFASYRPEPLVEELLRVPIPEPCSNLLDGLRSVEDIDQRVREAFNFKDAEWALVEDLFNVTLPDFKGDADSPGRKRTQRQTDSRDEEPELRHYCEYFIRVLKAGFGQDKQIRATVFHETGGDLLPYRLVSFELNKPTNEQFRIKQFDSPALLSELESLNQTWLRSCTTVGGSIYHQRVARIYDYLEETPTIFILKPDACRYWTRSMGLHDADEVSADFSRWRSATKAD